MNASERRQTAFQPAGAVNAAWILRAFFALLLVACHVGTSAQTYTSASTTYNFVDSSTHSKVGYQTAPYKFNAASGCGTTPPTLDDALSDAIPLGFTFRYGSVDYTSLYIMTNGRLQFGNTTCGFGTTNIGPPQTYPYGYPDAAMNATMKVFDADLDVSNKVDNPGYPTPCASIATCYISFATLGTAPSRKFVVTWKNVPEWVSGSNTSGSFDLQVILNEDGSFIYQYGTISHGGTGTAQIGWQLTTSDFQVLSFGAASEPPANTAIVFYIPAPVASYRFEEGAWSPGLAGQVLDSTGNARHGMSLGAAQPTASGKICRGASIPLNTSGAQIDAVKLVNISDTTLNLRGTGTVAFWFKSNVAWSSGPAAQLMDATTASGDWFYLTRTATGTLHFAVRDSTGVLRTVDTPAQNFAAGTWVHIAVGWNFNGLAGTLQDDLRIAINGATPTLSSFSSSGTVATSIGAIHLGDNPLGSADTNGSVNSANGVFDEAGVYNYVLTSSQLGVLMAATRSCTALAFDHLELQHGSGSGVTCTASTLTVRACANAACSSLYTSGVAATLTATGTPTTNFDSATGNGSGAAFVIPAGSGSVTKGVQVTTVGSVLLGASGANVTAPGATSCNFGSPSCTFTAADSGFIFNVPDHRAEVSNTISVTAVKKSDSSAACVPSFASVSKALTFKCSYVNPGSGTLPVRVGGTALNSANSSAAACDASGAAVTLAFDSTGKASTTVQYADVGSMTLAATYTGSGTDAGLTMTGSDGFITAPHFLSVSGITSGNLVAGNAFSATVTAKNYLGNPTPNFGREATPETATLGFVRTKPQGTGAVNGSFSGSLGGFSSGIATGSNLNWSEVGAGEVTARLTSGSYLGTGMNAAGASNYMTSCASEGGTCTLPTGVTAFVTYGANGWIKTASNVTGSIACNNSVFGDPIVGTAKTCNYFVISGSSAASAGSAGPFIPHHFDVAVAPACSAFSYAAQPFGTTVTARNASNTTTLNYDGTAATTPNYAKTTTLSDVPVLGLGAWTNSSIAVSAYAAGVATATPSYAFTNKTTAPQTLIVRAIDVNAVSSAGYAEGSTALKSGRLKLSNAFGSEKASLAIPVQAQYWSGNAWVQNSGDSCTNVPAAAVVRAAYLDNKGAATAGWTSTASAIAISAGAGTLTFGAPSPTTTGSLDFALNLGATTTDLSCLAAHPASTAGALPWLRSQNGGCSALWDRDPSARASFGIFSPETRKTVHVRELF